LNFAGIPSTSTSSAYVFGSHRAGTDKCAIADHQPFQQRGSDGDRDAAAYARQAAEIGAGLNPREGADVRIVADGDTAIDEDMVAKHRAGADHAVGADENPLAELCQRRYIGGGVGQRVVAQAEAALELRRQVGAGRRRRSQKVEFRGAGLKVIQHFNLRRGAQAFQCVDARRQRYAPRTG
jgi:hypothetical protein